MYFNYSIHIAHGRWDRRRFLRKWWKIYAGDPRWAPPAHGMLARALQPGRYEYVDSAAPMLLSVEAFRRTGRSMNVGGNAGGYGMWGSIFEEPVAASVLLVDPRRRHRIADLALFRFVNDEEVVERLRGILMEQLWPMGCRRIIGPTGLSPRLPGGILHDHFHRPPPLGTPYNPPYVPELLDRIFQPLHHSRLYHVAVTDLPQDISGPATLSPLRAERLAADLLPLFGQAFDSDDDTPPLDRPEALFLLGWTHAWPAEFWLASVDDLPVGFLALQPDLTQAVLRANGGRNPFWHAWLQWRKGRPATAARIVFGAVDKDWRRQGIGRQLWQHTIAIARMRGWRSLTIGPVLEGANTAAFLTNMGARSQQHYTTYYLDI